VLGGAGPFDFLRNEGSTVMRDGRAPTAAEVRDDVFEPVALYNARTGRDALPPERGERNPDIEAEFNPNAAGLYLGTDARPAANQIDFRTVVLHEIGHGLGIAGRRRSRAAGVDRHLGRERRHRCAQRRLVRPAHLHDDGRPGRDRRHPPAVPAGRLCSAAHGADRRPAVLVRAAGAHGSRRQGAPARAGAVRRAGAAPPVRPGRGPFVEGSSYSHLDERRYPRASPQALMTPYLEPGETYVDPGQIALGMLADMGWAVPALTGQRYTPTDPVRVLDTRSGLGARAGRLGAGQSVDLQVTGRPVCRPTRPPSC
jgi:hypothetical protein